MKDTVDTDKNPVPSYSGWYKRFLYNLLGYQPAAGFPSFLIEGIDQLTQLRHLDDFSLQYADGEWICHVDGLEFFLHSKEEVFILKEIFVDGVYNVDINHSFIFIDIGMNVGAASLFFAKRPECKKVVAFEPFQTTLSYAKKNFAKNTISHKIHVYETGLGYPPRTLKVNYSEESKGCVGINGLASYIEDKKDMREEQLPIMDVFEALNEFVDEKIIVKIDCEGSEYEIMKRLNDTGLIPRFDVIMIEWHLKGAASLRKILIDNHFEILSMGGYNLDTGMLYAFKR